MTTIKTMRNTAKMQKVEFSVQLKPVGSACNLQCDYCYVKPFRPTKTRIMSGDVLERIIASCLSNATHPIFTWHGGEPTLAGISFFKQALQLMERYRKPGQTITNRIQTNATRVDLNLATFFKDHNFAVSVSLDGPEYIHGIHRFNSAHNNSFNKTMKGIETLRKVGISPSVICTVTDKTLKYAAEVFRFLVANGFTKIKYSPVFDSISDSFSFGSDEWFEYLKIVFDIWFEMENPNIEIRDLDEVISWLNQETLPLCSSDRTCLRWVSINPDGDLYPCEYLKSKHSYGNILQMELVDIPQTPAYQKFLDDFLSPPEQCTACKFYSLCGNGCPATRIAENRITPKGVYVYCQERLRLYYYIKKKFLAALKTTSERR